MVIRIRYLVYALTSIIVFSLLLYFLSVGSSKNMTAEDMYSFNNSKSFINYKLKEDVKDLNESTDGLVTEDKGNNSSSESSGNAEVDKLVTTGEDNINRLWGFAKKYSKEHNADAVFVGCVIAQESNWGREAGDSNAGAKGVMQIIPKHVVADLKQLNLWESNMTDDMYDDENNIHIGVTYLKLCEKIIGTSNPADVGAAYNQGPYGYKQAGNQPSTSESRKYYSMVEQRYKDYLSGAKKIGVK